MMTPTRALGFLSLSKFGKKKEGNERSLVQFHGPYPSLVSGRLGPPPSLVCNTAVIFASQ